EMSRAETEPERIAESPSRQLGVSLDHLVPVIQRIYSQGQLVVIDKATRLPPLDAPMKAEWFGVQGLHSVGSISREIKYRISVIDEKILRQLENKRKSIRQILDHFTFAMGDDIRWMPNSAWDLFQEEMNLVDREGRALLSSILSGNVRDFVSSRRDLIVADANQMYREFSSSRNEVGLPDNIIQEILDDITARLEKAKVGQFLPKVSRNPMDFNPGKGAQSDKWNSGWGQPLTFLLSIAQFPRKAITDRFFLSGLRVDRRDLLAAMDVCKDSLIPASEYERAWDIEERAIEELDLLIEIRDVECDHRTKCEAILLVMRGEAFEAIKKVNLDSRYDPDTVRAIYWFKRFGLKDVTYRQVEATHKISPDEVRSLVDRGVLVSLRDGIQQRQFFDEPNNQQSFLDRNTKLRISQQHDFAAEISLHVHPEPTAWEMLHRLIRVLQDKGQEATARSMRQLPEHGKTVTDLARRLNSICERKKWKEEAKPYKELIAAWHCMISNGERANEPSPSD
ncbi:MAG: hypothetical protein M1358_09420, partial [Chloroflexi bacterium]|nr:hypothetical protein [Chloroflexota bacterium]